MWAVLDHLENLEKSNLLDLIKHKLHNILNKYDTI